MARASPVSGDTQTWPPAALCAVCGAAIYDDDVLYNIQGECVCEGCLEAFAADYFASRRMLGGQLWETF